MNARPKRLGVLISGRGSNLQALIDKQDTYGAYEIALVISNVPDAPGLSRAERAGIPTMVIDHRQFSTRMAFEEAMDAELRNARVELIALAGFMRILTSYFVRRWRNLLINIHPSLLPAFKGRHTHENALKEGVKLHGCTVHLVTEEVDAGPILGQVAVRVLPNDTVQSLCDRVLREEHDIYPQSVAALALQQSEAPSSDDRLASVWVNTATLAA
jgi:phosphoribosylglycinamide formyltransferase 1